MATTPQFSDNFVVANLSLQERLGRSGAALNKDSAVFSQQVRSFIQMLNFGNDAVTARAASHLLNMDILYSNDAYLLKLSEGLLLNSIRSITPPKINASTPLRFASDRSYNLWSSLGTISLKDGSKVNLIAFKIHAIGEVEGTDKGIEYEALYCAGNYVQQRIDSGFDGYTPGIFAPVYIGETYKSIWSESVEVTLDMDDGSKRDLKIAWSLNDLLAMPDNSLGALMLNTPRGLTLTLGDGEIFGKGYNDKTGISAVTITYVKCDSLAPVDHSTIKFNRDITPIINKGAGILIPVLSPLDIGDTADMLRTRTVAEFFAASKITDERDLETEVLKVPFVKSCKARKEYNWPFGETMRRLYEEYKTSYKSHVFYDRYKYQDTKVYNPGDMAVVRDVVYICTSPNHIGNPVGLHGWARYMSLSEGASIGSIYSKYYPSACIYDNATIVLSGLVMKNRRYWNEHGIYHHGDVVYHIGTNKLWLALRDGGQTVEPGSEEDVPLYGENGVLRFWATKEEAEILEDEATQPTDPYYNVGYKFDDYEQLTQAIFESEIKGYFNIAGKLGFTSVVVEPLIQIGVVVSCQYKAPYTIQQQIRDTISEYVCYQVGKELKADVLNSKLTELFNLSSVYVSIKLDTGDTEDPLSIQLPTASYVPPSRLEINLKESLA